VGSFETAKPSRDDGRPVSRATSGRPTLPRRQLPLPLECTGFVRYASALGARGWCIRRSRERSSRAAHQNTLRSEDVRVGRGIRLCRTRYHLRPLRQRASKARVGREYSARASCSHVLYPLLPLRSKGEVRCSPRLRRCSSVVRNDFAVSSSRKSSVFRTTTRSAHRRLWPSVRSVGV